MKTKCYRLHPWGLGELGRNIFYCNETREKSWPIVEGNKDIIGIRELEQKTFIFQAIWERAVLFQGIKRTC